MTNFEHSVHSSASLSFRLDSAHSNIGTASDKSWGGGQESSFSMINFDYIVLFMCTVIPTQNVVVVNQPGSSTERVETVQPQANDHMGLTLVIMLLCFLHGNLPAFACLIPALCFSYLVSPRRKPWSLHTNSPTN